MSDRFPWYDSSWLGAYVDAKSHIALRHPGRLNEFVDAFRPLTTRPDFSVQKIPRVFDEPVMAKIREAIRTLEFTQLELHEANVMGRVIVHNHALLNELQALTLPMVNELAGEPVEPFYNFLSLYSTLGVCPIHMDAPEAKWTLDLCIDQSEPWPIHFSNIVPWPEDMETDGMADTEWQSELRQSKDVQFNSFTLQPGEALLFSGSSQWHYRDPIPNANSKSYCNLVFFHFIPVGTARLIRPASWAELFSIPELSSIVGAEYSRVQS